jgi:hypothetical protein
MCVAEGTEATGEDKVMGRRVKPLIVSGMGDDDDEDGFFWRFVRELVIAGG